MKPERTINEKRLYHQSIALFFNIIAPLSFPIRWTETSDRQPD